jgi:peptidoglycan hydrolase-like protein with peptidoglycan-binding domain
VLRRRLRDAGAGGGAASMGERMADAPGAARTADTITGVPDDAGVIGPEGGDLAALDTRAVQRALSAAGFDPGPVDGEYGPTTQFAVARYRYVHGVDRGTAPTPVALLDLRLQLSPTVSSLLDRGDEHVPPREVVVDVLLRHADYAGGRGNAMSWDPDAPELRRSRLQWLRALRSLYDPSATPVLHGRLVVIGLALIDPAVRDALERAGVYDAVVAELREPLTALLGPRGRRLLRRADRLEVGRLSPNARRVLASAQGLRRTRSGDLRLSDLLICLEGGSSYARSAYAVLGPDSLRGALPALEADLSARWAPVPLTEWPPMSSSLRAAVDVAYQIADAVGSEQVRARYLLYGALAQQDDPVVAELARRGLRVDALAGWDEPSVVGPAPLTASRPATTSDTVPPLGHVREADRLGTAADVEMLVAVLLDERTPLPLAVGLFGDWGSGKSFFMALMQERMAELAKQAKDGAPQAAAYCSEIRQIRFNAWHYVDADLWSSLAATLFDELARPTPEEQAEHADKHVAELARARGERDAAHLHRERLEAEVSALEAAVEKPAAAVRSSLSAAIRAVREDGALRSRLSQEAARKSGQEGASTDADVAAQRLADALATLDDAGARAAALWRLTGEEMRGPRRRIPLVALAVATVAVLAGGILLEWSTAAKVLTAAATLMSSVALPALVGATRILTLARDGHDVREAPLLAKRHELALAQAREEKAAHEVTALETGLRARGDEGRRLQEFVRDRAASTDYRSRLGVIATVRRDLEELVGLLPGPGVHGAAVVPTAAEDPAARLPRVQRIVLYVDDLDRCPPKHVVEVLQAVHLLLAFRLFVVVVGVDSRWLERSLREHYQDLLSDPDDYLEKIFQIPFALRRMTGDQYRDLVDALAGAPPAPSPPAVAVPPEDAGSRDIPVADVPSTGEGAAPAPQQAGRSDGGAPSAATSPSTAPPVPPPAPPPPPEALVLTDDERDLLGALGPLVATPRSARRLVNIYRMLRVSVPAEESTAFAPDGGREFEAAMLLLAVVIGRPAVAAEVLGDVLRAGDDDPVWPVLTRSWQLAALDGVRARLTVQTVGPYRRWAPRVARFSFKLAGQQGRA